MWVSRYVCLFMLYSLMGWVYETIYCTIKSGKWDNRGFLFGPICPIYGTGAVAISVVVNLTEAAAVDLKPWQIYVISVVGSAVLEYVTSWALEKIFHAVWWDYSDMPLNIHGRISLFSSLGFGVGGLLIVYVIVPFSEGIMVDLSRILTEFLSLCLVFVFAADFTMTVNALHHFDRYVAQIEGSFNRSMESLVDGAVRGTSRIRQGISEKKTMIQEEANMLSKDVKMTIRRVSAFRERDGQRDSVKNNLLAIIKKIKQKSTGQKSAGEEE